MKIYRVSIIILNWNSWKDTIECLESLYRIAYPNYDVIVVDNGSRDDSVQKIKEYCEGKIGVNSKFFKYDPSNKPIKVFEISEDEAKKGKFNRPLYEKFDPNRRLILIKNRDNYGFAGGNNIGIKFALSVLNPDYILLLNNDTVVDKKFLDELVNVAENDERIGIVGSRINSYYNPDTILFAGTKKFFIWKGGFGPYFKYASEKKIQRELNNKHIIDTPVVEGSSMLIKRDVIYKIKLIPEEYFLYGEETDFCLNALRQGILIKVALRSKIWHRVSASVDDKVKLYYCNRNKFILARKYGNLKDFILLIFIDTIYSIFYNLLILKHPLKLLPLFQALIDGLKHTTRKRSSIP